VCGRHVGDGPTTLAAAVEPHREHPAHAEQCGHPEPDRQQTGRCVVGRVLVCHPGRGRFSRFYLYLSLFCFSMLNLIVADNLFQVFVSWELVGVCSFFLIGFYHERESAALAANKAFVVNRVGDAGFLIGLALVWTYFGTFNFQEIFTILATNNAEPCIDELEIFTAGKVRVEMRLLGDIANAPLIALEIQVDIGAVKEDVAGGGLEEAREHFHGG